MNKYLKILMLSGGLVGAIAPTAINMDKNTNNDLGRIYEQVEKMQEVLPRLSRINYKLNIDLPDSDVDENNTISNDINENNDTLNNSSIIDSDTISNNEDSNPIDNNDNSENDNSTNNQQNVTFTTTDELGNETSLSNEETLNYLNETLNQTNIEYEQLKITLSNAIKDTMDYLDSYKNGEITLTNEQKIYIKEHTNSIKFLAETLEDLSEDVLCCIDGCEDCDDEDFEYTANQYLTTIHELETRINALNNAIASLQFVNNIGNPFFYQPSPNHNHIIYGYDYDSQNNETNSGELNAQEDNKNDSNLTTDNQNTNTNNESNAVEVNKEDTSDIDNLQTTDSVQNTQSTQDNDSTQNNDESPTTFGLKSNVDTYAPTRRNIDTFFNTALYNNEYMNGNAYGYGYGAPYGGYGYGMPYGQGYYGNPYGGMGLNSNVVNREVMEQQNDDYNDYNKRANIEQEQNDEVKKPKKIHTKRAKNIDTYTGTTIQSNVNTMGESKISKFFKEKFNNLRNKVKNKKDGTPSPTQNDLSDKSINDEIISNDSKVIENTSSNLDNNTLENLNNSANNNIAQSHTQEINNDNIAYNTNNIENTLNQEKDIKATL